MLGLPRLLCVLGATLALAPASLGSPLTPQEERGKQIYFEGTSPRGEEIEAFIGEDLTPLPGSAAACASCHGADGRGRPEAGVIPSDITWDYLLKPYGHVHPMGRAHGPFTEEAVEEAIVRGRDVAGNDLDSSMPMYAMSDQDLADLIAYLKRLEGDLDPGLSGDEIRIGTILPRGGRMALIGQAIGEVLTAFFDAVNAGGGINNRRLRLVASSYDDSRGPPLAAATSLVEQGDVFAILSPVIAGADREIAELVERRKLPLIGPFSLFSADPYALGDYTFHLLSGPLEQAAALVAFATDELGLEEAHLALLIPGGEPYGEIEEAIRAEGTRRGWTIGSREPLPSTSGPAAAVAERLAGQGVDTLLILGPEDPRALLEAAAAMGWRPYVLSSGAFVRQQIFDLPRAFDGRIYLSYPTLPSDQTADAVARLSALLEEKGLPLRHRPSQISALAAAEVLAEGLKTAGRQLSRDGLLRSLETLHDFHTGLTPAITYGANRRIGALGSHVVRVDLGTASFVPVEGWFAPASLP